MPHLKRAVYLKTRIELQSQQSLGAATILRSLPIAALLMASGRCLSGMRNPCLFSFRGVGDAVLCFAFTSRIQRRENSTGEWKVIRSSVVVAASFLSFGCASVVNDSTHPIRVETKTSAGEMVTGADCKLSNDYGSTAMKSGETVQVRRSGKDLDIVCSQTGQTDARARAVSRANAGMFGNIILGGGIGAIIDHNKGTAYTYPTWVQLIFGKTMIFDRTAEKEGQPTPGTEPTAETASR